ncbi:MAG: hypothetical protein F6K11_31545 [Leptolyngbya sp. SIO3F4]|nr:hypothetical protein [Leptolyngbya sp. SIO3F4]
MRDLSLMAGPVEPLHYWLAFKDECISLGIAHKKFKKRFLGLSIPGQQMAAASLTSARMAAELGFSVSKDIEKTIPLLLLSMEQGEAFGAMRWALGGGQK